MSDVLDDKLVEAVKYLAAAAYDAGKHGAVESSSMTDASNELGHAIGTALAEKDAEIARLKRELSEAHEIIVDALANIEAGGRPLLDHPRAEVWAARIEHSSLLKDGMAK